MGIRVATPIMRHMSWGGGGGEQNISSTGFCKRGPFSVGPSIESVCCVEGCHYSFHVVAILMTLLLRPISTSQDITHSVHCTATECIALASCRFMAPMVWMAMVLFPHRVGVSAIPPYEMGVRSHGHCQGVCRSSLGEGGGVRGEVEGGGCHQGCMLECGC